MGWLVSLIFAGLAVIGFAAASATGSVRALVFGSIDSALGLVAFRIWAWSL